MTDEPETNSKAYDIGYKKPPKDHQFRPMKSGNPEGRPKTKRLEGLAGSRAQMRAVLKRKVPVSTSGGSKKKMTYEKFLIEKALMSANKSRDLAALREALAWAYDDCGPGKSEPMTFDYSPLLKEKIEAIVKRMSEQQAEREKYEESLIEREKRVAEEEARLGAKGIR